MNSFRKILPTPVKKIARFTLLKYRQPTWRDRSLPDFLIIGAQKAGTSSLYHYLGQHPQLTPAYVKEIHFFDGGLNPNVDHFQEGQAWYRAHFPLRKSMRTDQKTFEATPLYLFHPLVPQRIADLVPEAKLIVLLRDPVKRAISHYFYARQYRRESLPLMAALQAEEQRLRPAIENSDYRNASFLHHAYKSRGLYHDQIKRYLSYFPKENILILNSEKFYAEQKTSLRCIFEFLGVDPGFIVHDLSPRNVAKKRSEVTSEVSEYLNAYFQSPNQALYDLVGRIMDGRDAG